MAWFKDKKKNKDIKEQAEKADLGKLISLFEEMGEESRKFEEEEDSSAFTYFEQFNSEFSEAEISFLVRVLAQAPISGMATPDSAIMTAICLGYKMALNDRKPKNAEQTNRERD